MAARTKTPDKIEEAKSILSVWNANPEFKLKDLTLTRFQADYDRLAALIQQIEGLETSLMALRNERDDLSLTINSNTPVTFNARLVDNPNGAPLRLVFTPISFGGPPTLSQWLLI
jgi:hypothetical protein